MKSPAKSLLLCLLTAALLLPLCAGCAAKQKKYTDQAFEWFDSHYILTVYTSNEEDFERYAALCRAVIEKYHRLLDIYHTYEGLVNLKTINDAGGTAITVSEELFRFLQYAGEMHTLTEGYTNLAMGSVIALWQEAAQNAATLPYNEAPLPEPQALTEALAHTDIRSLVLSEQSYTVTLTDPLVTLNAGALGKGYAAEQVAKTLLDAGCGSFLLDLGGNVVAYGQKPGNTPWLVGIRQPSGHAGYVGSVRLEGQSLVTSGSYERHFMSGGVRYHHIIHPTTGYPDNTYVSVSVLCDSSATADALSTALFSMSPDKGMALVDSLPDTEAVWLMSNGQTVVSQGFEAYTEGADS